MKTILTRLGIVSLLALGLALLTACGTSDKDVSRIKNNLRQYDAAGQQFILETGKPVAGYADLVGPTKYITVLKPVHGEDYTTLTVSIGIDVLTVHTSDNREVSWRRQP